MNLRLKSSGPRRPTVAMTLLEIMVAVSLLSLIVLTLYNMFDRTQKALRGTRNQTDIAEAGRAGLETLVREIQQMRAMSSWSASLLNVHVDQQVNGNSFIVSANSNLLQTNILLGLFFHNFSPQTSPSNWAGIAYWVGSSPKPTDPWPYSLADDYPWNPPTNGVGTLYRYESRGARPTNGFFSDYFNNFTRAPSPTYPVVLPANRTNRVQRVCDGVIHFNLRFYINGAPTNMVYPSWLLDTNLPSHVEIELGIIPPTLLDQAKAFPAPTDQRNFLSTRGDKVQMFRQLVPIQTVLR